MLYAQFLWQYLSARFDIDARRDDRGVLTTEFAVIAFLVVAGAIAIVGIVLTVARNNANNIPSGGG